jgi:hypothetical protein
MNNAPPAVRLSFRVHLIRIHGPESTPVVRVLLVETTSAVAIYEGFGAWSTCKRWIERLSDIGLSPDELAVVRNSLERRRLVTIQEVRASLDEIELLGLHRADGSK